MMESFRFARPAAMDSFPQGDDQELQECVESTLHISRFATDTGGSG
jgi:hypothetical protein